MRKFGIFILTTLISYYSHGQLFRPDSIGLNYFDRGSELIKIGDYHSADSLFTLALCSFKNENVYYNRAISRAFLNDTLGFCQDMEVAANRYFDNQAAQYYNTICCSRVDTLYFKQSRVLSDKSKYRYYEIIKYPLYDTIISGSFHDAKNKESKMVFDFGCEAHVIGLNTYPTDLIAGYYIEDSVKYYFNTTQPIDIFNRNAYDKLKQNAKEFFNSKYSYLKKDNDIEKLKVYFQVYFNEHGEVMKVMYKGFFPEIVFDKTISELEQDIIEIANNYPKVRPAKFFNKAVAFIAYDSIEF